MPNTPRALYNTSLFLTTTMVNSKILNKSLKNPTLSSGIQDSSNGMSESPEPALELVSKFTQEGDFKLVALQGALLGVSLLLLPQGTLLLRPYLHLPQKKVRRRVWVLTPRRLLPQG